MSTQNKTVENKEALVDDFLNLSGEMSNVWMLIEMFKSHCIVKDAEDLVGPAEIIQIKLNEVSNKLDSLIDRL